MAKLYFANWATIDEVGVVSVGGAALLEELAAINGDLFGSPSIAMSEAMNQFTEDYIEDHPEEESPPALAWHHDSKVGRTTTWRAKDDKDDTHILLNVREYEVALSVVDVDLWDEDTEYRIADDQPPLVDPDPEPYERPLEDRLARHGIEPLGLDNPDIVKRLADDPLEKRLHDVIMDDNAGNR